MRNGALNSGKPLQLSLCAVRKGWAWVLCEDVLFSSKWEVCTIYSVDKSTFAESEYEHRFNDNFEIVGPLHAFYVPSSGITKPLNEWSYPLRKCL